MKAEIKFVKTKDFICTTGSGQLNLGESREMLARLAALNSQDDQHDLLVDIRDTTSVLTLSDIYELVAEVSRQRHAFRKQIAVLIGPQHDIDKARFLEMCAANRGFDVNVLDDFEEAVTWLMSDEE